MLGRGNALREDTADLFTRLLNCSRQTPGSRSTAHVWALGRLSLRWINIGPGAAGARSNQQGS